jgi:hypothetical protein
MKQLKVKPMHHNYSWELGTYLVQVIPACYRPPCFLPCSQEPDTEPYHEQAETALRQYARFL